MWRVRGRKLRWKRKWKLRWKRKWRRKWRRAKRRGGRSRKGAESRGERGVVYGWGRCQGRSQWGCGRGLCPRGFQGWDQEEEEDARVGGRGWCGRSHGRSQWGEGAWSVARGGVKAGDGPMIPGLEAGFIWEESKEEPVVKGAWSVRKGGAGGGEERRMHLRGGAGWREGNRNRRKWNRKCG